MRLISALRELTNDSTLQSRAVANVRLQEIGGRTRIDAAGQAIERLLSTHSCR